LKDVNALLPIANKKYKGDPMKASRVTRGKAKLVPTGFHLGENEIVASEAGSKQFQLLDDKKRLRETHALVVEGADWVEVVNQPDGHVDIMWSNPPAGAVAKVLFGWKGGVSVFERNDWTMPPIELMIVANPAAGQLACSPREEGCTHDSNNCWRKSAGQQRTD
jgi:hypothetical protein